MHNKGSLLLPQIEGWFDMEGIRAAFEAVDFVGISAYVAQESVDFQPCDMERLMEKARGLVVWPGTLGPGDVPWRLIQANASRRLLQLPFVSVSSRPHAGGCRWT